MEKESPLSGRRPWPRTFRFPASGIRYLLCFLLPLGICHSAPAPQDLGHGLAYVRLRRLPDDAAVLAAAWKAPALIVDLRHTTGDPAQALPPGLPPRPRSAPLFALVGPATAPALFAVIREHAPALISLGLAAPALTPDIVLSVSPEADRGAYDALEGGAPIESLISEKMAKPRFDEAVLAQEHKAEAAAESAPAPTTPGPAGPAPAAAPPPAPAPEPAPRDAVLERAVQLHRALLALGKLPAG
jgi:hypothetical protein